MFFVGSIGAFCGVSSTILTDHFGRANMYLLANGMYIIVAIMTTLNWNKNLHYLLVFLIRFSAQAIMVIDTV